MDLTLNREKTRETRLTEGVDFLGVQFVKRKSPTSGKNTIYLFPAKSAPQAMRNNLKYLTSRRAPIRPQAFVEQVNPLMTGWVNYFRHTNASHAFRELQRFVHIRFRRYLTQRSKGRGFGWHRYPNRKLYARGLTYIGSGKREYVTQPAHGGRGRLSDRRIREN
jgi:RNA-directed DNA polymerase